MKIHSKHAVLSPYASLFFCWCLSPNLLHAQVIEATDGYVILANNDTVRCQINLESEVLMSKRIELDRG